jgi:membrane protein DedA with SNARE-associated domain
VLVRWLSQFGYFAVVALLVAGGVGVPVPEELVQLTAGYLARREVLSLPGAIAAAYGGIVAGDFIFFRIAQRHGAALLARRHVARLVTPARRELFERHFARHAFLTIVVARHTSGFRIPAYALAATHGVGALTFLAADALSALLSVPLVVTIGWYFAGQIEMARHRVHQVELALAVAVAVSAAVWMFWRWHRERSEPPPPPPLDGPPGGKP